MFTDRIFGRGVIPILLLVLCFSSHAADCSLYPIALSSQTLTGVQPGTVVNNIMNGKQPGNFGWLTWAGSPSV
ncbi:MAG TPA: hypothetical protein DCZ95_05275, partial [Verrucomicrobia bacterium]|nr:hypothetical protein [Verrucomicrobiota bacterium]